MSDLPESKLCQRCGVVKSSDEFYKKTTSRDGLQGSCKSCDILRRKQARWREKLDVVVTLGNKCACPNCDTVIPEWLTIDHINGGGTKHRATLNGGSSIYKVVKNAGYPRDTYQILCWNCNASIGLYGYCPHDRQVVIPMAFAELGKETEL